MEGTPLPDPARGLRRSLVLAIVLVGAFMILLDTTIVNVAVPTIERSLHASASSIEWVVSGYALAYGLLLIPAGRLGDRHGHKLVYLVGLVGFTATSLLCGTFVTGTGTLIAWRVAQGATAGIMNPSILAVIQHAFPPRERGRAMGMYGAVAGLATAIGPLAGGLLIAWNLAGLDWRAVFLVNVPIGVAAVAAALRYVPQSGHHEMPIDWAGMGIVSLALLLLTYPLVQGQPAGWPAWTFVSMGAGAVGIGAFALWERRVSRHGGVPVVDVALFGIPAFAAGTGIGLAFYAGFIGLLFALSLHLQIGLGWSALAAGLALVPFAGGTLVGGAVSDRLARRLGHQVLVLGSAVVAVAIMAVILTLRDLGGRLEGIDLLPALAIGGIGTGLVIAPNVGLILATVPRREAGSASGVLSSAQRVGQALGIAVVGSVLFGALGSFAPAAARAVAKSLRGHLQAAHLPLSALPGGVSQFGACFTRQMRSADPTRTPAGCAGRGPARLSEAFSRAAHQALAADFTHAVQDAAWYALAAVVLTLVLVFLLPRRGSAVDEVAQP